MGDLDIAAFTPSALGRFGGVIAIAMGTVVLFGGAALLWQSWSAGIDDTGEAGMLVVPGGALVIGPLMMLAGVWALRTAPRPRSMPKMPLAEARRLIETRQTPFWVCTRCREFYDRDWGVGCAECGSSVDHLEVSDDDERAMACSALGSR